MIIDISIYNVDKIKKYSLRQHFYSREHILEIVDIDHGSPDTNFHADITRIIEYYTKSFNDGKVRFFINMFDLEDKFREVKCSNGDLGISLKEDSGCNITRYLRSLPF